MKLPAADWKDLRIERRRDLEAWQTRVEKTALNREPNNLSKLRARLAEAEAALRAIRNGDVDSVVVAGKQGSQVFTLQGAEHAYRVLIESMNEGALTLTTDKTILYANHCFARLVKCPLEQVVGSSFRRFLSVKDRAALRSLLKLAARSGAKIQVQLNAGDGSQIPVHISIRPLPRNRSSGAIFGMVVTDMTEARRTSELLRALSHRVVDAQEAERGRVALELHDNITQHLCAILFRGQALAGQIPDRDGALKREVMKLQQMLSTTADEVERISRDLRPGVLEQLGLVEVVRATSTEFADRTGVSTKLVCAQLSVRPPADTELAIYRILQEALRNVEEHADARHVTVCLRQRGAFVQLVVKDDGAGFDPDHHPTARKGQGGLGLLGMRERASYAGGAVKIKSARRAGTEIEVRIPLPASLDASDRGGATT
jgi:PAS domain S-box-containing protein